MTELDPSLVLKAFATPQMDVGQLLETRQQLKLRNLAQQKAERQEADALAQQERRSQIGAQYAGGDSAGARREAIGAGDFDLVKQLDQMDEGQRKRITEVSQATAPLLLSLKNVPDADRLSALEQIAPDLQARGFTPEKIQEVARDLSNGALDRIGASAMTIEQYNKANEAYTLSPGSKRFQGAQEIASVPFAPRTISVSPGEEVIEYLPGGGSPSGSGGIDFSRLIQIESGGNHFTNGKPTTSSAGAIGIAQVMPGTAPEAARLAGVEFDADRYRNDPAYNRQLGEAYYNAQRAKYGDDFKAAAAYNAGPGAVDKAIARGGDNWLQHLPAETRAYVAKLGGGGQGGPNVIARGAPKTGWKTLTPQEAQAQGLPSGGVYQQSPQGEIKAVGGSSSTAGPQATKQQIGTARLKINSLKAIEGQLARVEAAAKALEKGGFSGPVGQWVPGSFDAESGKFDKAVAQLGPLIRQLTRVPGEGAMSDFESRLADMANIRRGDSKAARDEAIAGMKELIRLTREGYSEFINPTSTTAAKPAVSNW